VASPPCSAAGAPGDDQVHLIIGRPEAATPRARAMAGELLDDAERQSAARLARDRDRELYAYAHALLRLTVSRYLGVEARDVRFTRRPGGRPELLAADGAPPLRFNLSHTRSLVACVITLAADCGVDAETLRAGDPAGFLATVLTPTEVAALLVLPEHRRPRRLVELWTLKEAYAKARGLGLALAPTEVSLSDLDTPHPRATLAPGARDDGAEWLFWSIPHMETHHVAVAVRSRGMPMALSAFEFGGDSFGLTGVPPALYQPGRVPAVVRGGPRVPRAETRA
jgi:4'-phosphopantetheinyl transferase